MIPGSAGTVSVTSRRPVATAAVEPLLEAVLVDRDATGPERREPGGAGLDEVDPVAEPGEPDGADETDVAGADDGERTFRGGHRGRAYQSSADAGRRWASSCGREDRPAGRPARPCRLRWCASRSTGSRGSDTCPRSSPTRRPVSRPSSIRVATSTSTSTRRGPPTFGSRTSSRPTSTTTTCPGVVSWRRSSGRRTSSAPAPASPTSTARPATATRSTSGRSGSRPWTRRATRRSTSATRSPTRPAATSRSCS